MVCDDCVDGSGKGMEEQDGVPHAAAESKASRLNQDRCPICKAWTDKDGVCNNPQCSTNHAEEDDLQDDEVSQQVVLDVPETVLIPADELSEVEAVTISQVRSVEAKVRVDCDDVVFGDIAQASDREIRSVAFDRIIGPLGDAGAQPETIDFEEIERYGDHAVVTQVRSISVTSRLTPDDHPEVFQGDVTEEALQSAAFDEMMPHLVDAGIEPLTLDFQEFDVEPKSDIACWESNQIRHWEQEFTDMREGIGDEDFDPAKAARETVEKKRQAIDHILEEGLEIGTVHSHRIPVDFEYHKDYGWVFVSRAEKNYGNIYPVDRPINAEVRRLEDQ
jgi:hypothetical protein